jgi:hypothetical protein
MGVNPLGHFGGVTVSFHHRSVVDVVSAQTTGRYIRCKQRFGVSWTDEQPVGDRFDSTPKLPNDRTRYLVWVLAHMYANSLLFRA